MMMTRGTDAHGGNSADFEELIATDLNCFKPKSRKQYTYWNIFFSLEGVPMMFQHHPPMYPSKLPWMKNQSALRMAAKLTMTYAGKPKAPKLAVYSHVHRKSDSENAYPIRVITTPAFCLQTSFIHRIGADAVSDIGALLISCEKGSYEIRHFCTEFSEETWVNL